MNDIAPQMNRRSFLIATAAAGGGLAIGFDLPFGPEAAAQSTMGAPEVTAWVVIQKDERVTIRIARSEMGQGTATGLAQMVAEELECDWSKVQIEFPTPGESLRRGKPWGRMFTAGSRGIRESNEAVRKGGATARMMLIQAAANEWKVPARECVASKSVITHKPSGKTISYGKVAEAASKLEPPKDVALKDPKDWKVIGKPVKRLDTAPKVMGQHIYVSDVKLPGMLVATIKSVPVFGGKLKSFDAAKVMGMPGVKAVFAVQDNAVAVIAEHWWEAKQAIDVLPIQWDVNPEHAKVSSESIAAFIKTGLDASEAFVGNQNGDVKAALAGAAKRVEATYSYPYQNHAPMEPMNAVVRYTAERCETWAATQDADVALAAVAEASGLPAEKCEVHKMPLGGGFGRRTTHDWLHQAVHIAKQMPGTPVKLQWSREEDMTQGRYHPTTQCKLTGGLDANGNLTALHMRLAGQSILAYVRPAALENGKDPFVFQGLNAGGDEGRFGYTVPNLLIDHAMRNPHVPPHFWRGVNNNQNAIYLECFMDELAQAAGQDPLAFRRKLMANHPKHLAVLNAVAEHVGWGRPAPQGIYRGLAQHMGYGSYVAACAEVSVNDKGTLKVHRIVAATDCGYAVNPAQIERQIAGSFVYGLSAALYGECTVKNGAIVEENFDTYNVLRMDEMPKVEVLIRPSGGFWGGVGEPTIFVAAPAVLNAIAAATGQRVRNLPIKNNKLRSV